MYLIYPTEQEAWERSEQEGVYIGLAYHKTGTGSRYVTAPLPDADGSWVLPVDGYNLDEVEAATVVFSFTPLPEPTEI